MIKYCPKCGGKNEYEIDPPAKCKCGLNFAEAFKVKHGTDNKPEVIHKKPVLKLEDDEEYEIVRVKKSKKISRGAENKTTKELEAEEFTDEEYETLGKEGVKDIAQELTASLDVNDFVVEYEDHALNFKDIYKEKLDNEGKQK